MVDPYQAKKLPIDNGINEISMCSNDQLFTINSTQNMNESNRLMIVHEQHQLEQQQLYKQTLETNTNECNSNNSDKCNTNHHLDGNDIKTNVITTVSDANHWNNVNECFSGIMCGPLSQHGMKTNETSTKSECAVVTPTSVEICTNQQNGDGDLNETFILNNNLDALNDQRGIDSEIENSNKVRVIVNKIVQKTESNDSSGNKNRLLSLSSSSSATSSKIQNNTDSGQHLQQSQSIRNFTSLQQQEQQQIATITMDSRKVEPLRININREPIKTKIKLATSHSNSDRANQSMLSPKSSSSTIDESDDGQDIEPSHTQNYPRITIKPIVKPQSFESSDYHHHSHHNHQQHQHHHHQHHHHHNHHHPNNIASVSSIPTQDGIPKLIISGNSQNYQKHIVSTESNIVPKLTASLAGSTSNLSIGSNSHDDDDDSCADDMDGKSSSMGLIPKLTIKLDQHQPHQSNVNDLTRKEVSLVSNDGVKVTLKPIAEPPLPKFTIKTNAFNDTAKLVMINNTITNNEQTDESSDEQPSQPASAQPSPNDKIHTISSTSLNSAYMGQATEDNLSTCSFGSSSSYSSSSSTTTPNNDIKLIIKATSTGSCVVSPNSLSIARNSPSSTSIKNSASILPKMISKSNLNNLASSIVSSSTPSMATATPMTPFTLANQSNDTNAIPKLNIKLSGSGEYPQVIHNNDMETTNKLEQTTRTGSPLPKFTIRKTGSSDENIIIPKVTIKPVIKPNENAEASLVTPKIILKPIPKPIDKPLEINTSGPGSPFRCATDMESQQSPRIILKINKNTMSSQSNETNALTSTTIIQTDEMHTIDPTLIMHHHNNDLKRGGATHDNDFQAKKSKIDAEIVLSSDSDLDENDRTTNATSKQIQINNHNDKMGTSATSAAQQTNVIMQNTSETIETAPAPPSESSTFDSNSGLRSILSRPQMKIQPQPLQTFLKALPPFKNVTTVDNNKTNDVIDLCHDSNDQLQNEQSNDKIINQIACHTEKHAIVTEPLRPNQSKTDFGFNWQCFYDESKDQNEPAHPLVRQNIERTNVLAALMEAERNREKSTNGNTNNNNSMAKESLDQRLNATTKGNHSLLLENDGSSSDCIVVEDTASEPFPTMDYGSAENTSEQNGGKKESMDRDSGVEVSINSVKSISEDGTTPVAKRPRGRPRKLTATPKSATKKHKSVTDLSKRKFAGVLMTADDCQMDVKPENSIEHGTEQITSSTSSTTSTSESSMPQTSSELITSSTISTMSQDLISCENEMIISSVAAPITQENTAEDPNIPSSPTLPNNNESTTDVLVSLLASEQLEIPNDFDASTSHENDGASQSASVSLAIPTTPTTSLTPGISKERKRRIIVDDDDESPTFNPVSRSSGKKSRGKNRRNTKASLLKQKQRQILFAPPDKANENAIFTSPESIDRRKLQAKDAGTPALQVFEEDTRMSADSLMTSPTVRTTEFLQNEESQSSLHSSASATVESSAKKFRSKIEVVDPEGRTEFTVDMIAEYDWPPPKGCCPSRNRDTYMIQEQIAEYLGVKSFKRKYPDLPRRMVEMEERNYLMEKCLVSEKMCDLGLTAVLASDVLDIMHSDFYEKFDEYRRYLREKQMREISARQKQMQAGMSNKCMSARDSAMRAASMWNSDFNRSRNDNRRECFDLQNLVIQIPERLRNKNRPVPKPSNYPVALVPGQFQEYYRTYSAAELLCYPINTVLADPHDLDRKLREYYQEVQKSRCISDNDDSDSDSNGSSSSDSDSDSDSSDSSDESSASSEDDKPLSQIKPIIDDKPKEKPIPIVAKADRNKCYICKGIERCNSYQRPELFISCTRCDRNVHPTCMKMSSRMVRRINEYAWHCEDCQICIKCRTGDNEDKMMHCDQCDRCYHIYCIGLRKVPNGKWHCAVCTVCTMCGARRPEGHNNPNLTPQQKQKLLAVAKWTHEYEENPLTKEQEHVAILCTSCLTVKNSASKSQSYFS